VLSYFFERLPGGGYAVPSTRCRNTDDPVADTERFNRIVESEVRRMPAQYLWIHRRFKGLTPDYPNYYV
jgi:KDO2-lipid IV(A) lauroyltransferase